VPLLIKKPEDCPVHVTKSRRRARSGASAKGHVDVEAGAEAEQSAGTESWTNDPSIRRFKLRILERDAASH